MPETVPIIASGNDNGNEIGNDNEKKTLEILRTEPSITAKTMAEKMGVSVRKIGRIMKKLREDSIITRIDPD